jgi:hypothetical protein
VLVGRVQVGAGLGAARRDGGEGGMAALRNGDVTPRPIWRVVRGVAVVRGHCVPKVLQGRGYSASMLAMSTMWCAGGEAHLCPGESYCCAMVSRSQGRAEQQKERMGALCAVNL